MHGIAGLGRMIMGETMEETQMEVEEQRNSVEKKGSAKINLKKASSIGAKHLEVPDTAECD